MRTTPPETFSPALKSIPKAKMPPPSSSSPDTKIQQFILPPQHLTPAKPAKCSASPTEGAAICSGPVYQCTQCSIRMCEPCILTELDKPESTHEATHNVQELVSNLRYNFSRFVEQEFSFTSPRKKSPPRSFLSSAHAFTPSPRYDKAVVLDLNLPSGSYNLSVRLYTQSHQDNLVNLQLLDRLFRDAKDHCKGVNLGWISISTQTDAQKKPSWSRSVYIDVVKGNAIRLDRDIVTNYSLNVHSTLKVRLRYNYDTKFFSKGPPFSWWLHELTLSREKELYRIATKEQVESWISRQTVHHDLPILKHHSERRRIEEHKIAQRSEAQREAARREEREARIRRPHLMKEDEEIRREREQQQEQLRVQKMREEKLERRIDEEMMRGEDSVRAQVRRERRRLERREASLSNSSFSLSDV